ncbi:MAG: hypothetical protein ACXABY_26625 [Candidatus Thorarchaeota archaeon]
MNRIAKRWWYKSKSVRQREAIAKRLKYQGHDLHWGRLAQRGGMDKPWFWYFRCYHCARIGSFDARTEEIDWAEDICVPQDKELLVLDKR